MNITTDSILHNLQKSTEDYEDALMVQNRRKQIRRMRNEEAEYISKGVCALDTTLDIRNHLASLDPVVLKNAISSFFYNQNVMRAMTCVMESTFITMTSNTDDKSRQIREWYNNLKVIGAPSVSGTAMSTSMRSEAGMIILKAPQNPRNNNDFIHELFVGLYGTNDMRKYIPNFAYVYGGFTCNPPKIEDKDVISWCVPSNGSSTSAQYIAYETIFPSIDFKTFVGAITTTPEDFIIGYLQVVLALGLAEKKIGFTHNDLHYENVLMREVNNTPQGTIKGMFYLKMYNIDGGEIYIKTNRIATIIDYGRCNITFNGKEYGYAGVPGVLPDKGNVLIDCYRLLMTSARVAINRNHTGLINVCINIVKYFNNKIKDIDTLIDNLQRQSKAYYVLPYDLPNHSIEGFTAHVMNLVVKSSASTRIRFSAPSNRIIIEGKEELIDLPSMIKSKTNFNDIREYYYKYREAIARSAYDDIFELRNNFNMDLLNGHLQYISNESTNINEAYESLPNVTGYTQYAASRYIEYITYNNIRTYVYNSIKINDRYNAIIVDIKILLGVSSLHINEVAFNQAKSLSNNILIIGKKIDNSNNIRKSLIVAASNNVKRFVNYSQLQPAGQKRYDWYVNEAPSLI